MSKHLPTLIFFIFVALSCQRREYVCINGYAQGGTYMVKCTRGDIPPDELKDGIDSILSVIDGAVNGYNPSSLLSRSNAGEILTDDGSAQYRVFNEISALGESVALLTGGVVDPRAAALFDVWGFGFKEGTLPSPEALRAAKNDRSKLNFNAIAQGYSSDKVAQYLVGHGIVDMLVNIGGEMYCRGLNPRGKTWSIGIDSPVDGNMTPGKDMAATFSLDDCGGCGVVTSGNYRKFYVVDGVKYSHTIDPRSGRPVQHNLLSATIIAPSSALADAYATFCMVVGADSARAFIEKEEGLEACLITSDTIWCSSHFPELNR